MLQPIIHLYNIISNLGISYIVSTPFTRMKDSYFRLVQYSQLLVLDLVRRHQSLCHHKRGFRCNLRRSQLFSQLTQSINTSHLISNILNCLIREILHPSFRKMHSNYRSQHTLLLYLCKVAYSSNLEVCCVYLFRHQSNISLFFSRREVILNFLLCKKMCNNNRLEVKTYSNLILYFCHIIHNYFYNIYLLYRVRDSNPQELMLIVQKTMTLPVTC